MEEKFFFQYHMHMDWENAFNMPVFERRWLIDRFVHQKEKENEAIESAQRKSRK
jgi:hypothetical protein